MSESSESEILDIDFFPYESIDSFPSASIDFLSFEPVDSVLSEPTDFFPSEPIGFFPFESLDIPSISLDIPSTSLDIPSTSPDISSSTSLDISLILMDNSETPFDLELDALLEAFENTSENTGMEPTPNGSFGMEHTSHQIGPSSNNQDGSGNHQRIPEQITAPTEPRLANLDQQLEENQPDTGRGRNSPGLQLEELQLPSLGDDEFRSAEGMYLCPWRFWYPGEQPQCMEESRTPGKRR